MPPSLSTSDSLVLTRLFDPEAAPTSTPPIDPNLPPDAHVQAPALLAHLRHLELTAIKPIETHLSPSPDPTTLTSALTTAITALTSLTTAHPTYASAYTNRAQCTRLLATTPTSTNLPLSATEILVHTTALSDLATAIALSAPASPETPVSPAAARTLASAHTQRATMFLAAAREQQEGDAGSDEVGRGDGTARWTKEELERRASADFAVASRYGSRFAGAMVARTNPYAKMCGAVVRRALRVEMEGSSAAAGLV